MEVCILISAFLVIIISVIIAIIKASDHIAVRSKLQNLLFRNS